MSQSILLESSILVSPGLPYTEFTQQLLTSLLFETALQFVPTHYENADGRKKLPKNSANPAAIAQLWSRSKHSFFVYGENGSYVNLSFEGEQGARPKALTLRMPVDLEAVSHFEQLTTTWVKVLGSPYATISAVTDLEASHPDAHWRKSDALQRQREDLHMQADRAEHGMRDYGLHRGLPGIAWRTYFGSELVQLIGKQRFAALESSRAEAVTDDTWLIRLDSDPLTWTVDAYTTDEQELVEHFGQDYFFNPSTQQLPTHYPALAEKAIAFPATTRAAKTKLYMRGFATDDFSLQDMEQWAKQNFTNQPPAVELQSNITSVTSDDIDRLTISWDDIIFELDLIHDEAEVARMKKDIKKQKRHAQTISPDHTGWMIWRSRGNLDDAPGVNYAIDVLHFLESRSVTLLK